VRLLCRCLRVTRSGFYAWTHRPPSARATQDGHLLQRLCLVHARHRRLYGRPRLHRALRSEGVRISAKRVRRLMQAGGLTAVGRRPYRVTTDSAHAWPVATNRLARQFGVTVPHQRWAADITALPTGEGWGYLAVVLDLGSRRVVGWAIRPSLHVDLVLAALHVALASRPHPQLHHSDRGVQYASDAYRRLLAQAGITISMSRVGNCWDNAPVESFFSSLKTELVSQARWTTLPAAETAVSDYLRFYNEHRLHSALDYRSPAAYEIVAAV